MALERTLKMIVLNGDVQDTINLNNASTTVSPQVINTAMHQLNNLTTSTYLDTHIVDTQSLNEIMETIEGGN